MSISFHQLRRLWLVGNCQVRHVVVLKGYKSQGALCRGKPVRGIRVDENSARH